MANTALLFDALSPGVVAAWALQTRLFRVFVPSGCAAAHFVNALFRLTGLARGIWMGCPAWRHWCVVAFWCAPARALWPPELADQIRKLTPSKRHACGNWRRANSRRKWQPRCFNLVAGTEIQMPAPTTSSASCMPATRRNAFSANTMTWSDRTWNPSCFGCSGPREWRAFARLDYIPATCSGNLKRACESVWAASEAKAVGRTQL